MYVCMCVCFLGDHFPIVSKANMHRSGIGVRRGRPAAQRRKSARYSRRSSRDNHDNDTETRRRARKRHVIHHYHIGNVSRHLSAVIQLPHIRLLDGDVIIAENHLQNSSRSVRLESCAAAAVTAVIATRRRRRNGTNVERNEHGQRKRDDCRSAAGKRHQNANRFHNQSHVRRQCHGNSPRRRSSAGIAVVSCIVASLSGSKNSIV